MPATLIIKLPMALEKLNPVIHQKLDKFVVQQKDKVNIQCLSDTNLTEVEFHHNWSSNASRIVGEVIHDFCLLFPEFTNQSKKKKVPASMVGRPSDLFNQEANEQVEKQTAQSAIEAEQRAQERALLKKHSIEKEITYISKDGLFSSNNLDDLIEKMNQDKEYQKLLNEVNAHLKTVKGDTDIRDIIEYVVANYKLERKA